MRRGFLAVLSPRTFPGMRVTAKTGSQPLVFFTRKHDLND
jgi:hypothetical protein